MSGTAVPRRSPAVPTAVPRPCQIRPALLSKRQKALEP